MTEKPRCIIIKVMALRYSGFHLGLTFDLLNDTIRKLSTMILLVTLKIKDRFGSPINLRGSVALIPILQQ